MVSFWRQTAVLALSCAGCLRRRRPGASRFPASPAQAPLRLIVPFTPGTGIDLIARTVGPKLGERLGRPVVVDNRAGASGNIGTEAVVRAAPNGSTLLVSVNTLVMNRSLYPKLPFDPVKDLVPVSLTSWGQLLLVASPNAGYKSAAELIAAAKSRPGAHQLRQPGRRHAASPVDGTVQVHGGHFLHPYPLSRHRARASPTCWAARSTVAFLPIHVALPHVKAGKLVALGIGSDKRHALLPDVPTLAEARAGDVNVAMWYGIFAPPGTSPEFVSRLNRELKDILATPEVRSAFETQGMDPATSSPEEFSRLVAQDAQRWAELIKARNITAE